MKKFQEVLTQTKVCRSFAEQFNTMSQMKDFSLFKPRKDGTGHAVFVRTWLKDKEFNDLVYNVNLVKQNGERDFTTNKGVDGKNISLSLTMTELADLSFRLREATTLILKGEVPSFLDWKCTHVYKEVTTEGRLYSFRPEGKETMLLFQVSRGDKKFGISLQPGEAVNWALHMELALSMYYNSFGTTSVGSTAESSVARAASSSTVTPSQYTAKAANTSNLQQQAVVQLPPEPTVSAELNPDDDLPF